MDPAHPTPDADRDLAALRAFVAERDTPCPSCGYNLRGLPGAHCPECDQALALRVGLVEPRLAAFITGLGALSAGAGFCAIVLVWMVIMTLPSGFPLDFSDFYPGSWILGAGLLVLGPALGLWIRLRTRVARLAPVPRWSLVLVAFAAAAVPPVLFFRNIF